MPRTPIQQQIIDDITTAIRSGQLKPGEKLPTIVELCAQYRASTTPVKNALAILEERGLIERWQGKGSYVAPSGL